MMENESDPNNGRVRSRSLSAPPAAMDDRPINMKMGTLRYLRPLSPSDDTVQAISSIFSRRCPIILDRS